MLRQWARQGVRVHSARPLYVAAGIDAPLEVLHVVVSSSAPTSARPQIWTTAHLPRPCTSLLSWASCL
jgi:hypothetical protein